MIVVLFNYHFTITELSLSILKQVADKYNYHGLPNLINEIIWLIFHKTLLYLLTKVSSKTDRHPDLKSLTPGC